MSAVTDRPVAPSAPAPDLLQAFSALERANQVRSFKASLRRDLRSGTVRFSDLVMDTPWWLLRAPVYEVALQVRGVGREKVARVLMAHGFSPWVRFGDLSPSRRRELADATARWGVR